MKLSAWAETQRIGDRTAYRWCRAGTMAVCS
jgi:predicted site-specific integrase-resolvase